MAIRIITSKEIASISPSRRISLPALPGRDAIPGDARDQLAVTLGVSPDDREQNPPVMEVLGPIHDEDRVVADHILEDPVRVAGPEVPRIGGEHLLGLLLGRRMTKTLDAGPRLSEKIGPYLRRHRSMNSIGRYIQRSV